MRKQHVKAQYGQIVASSVALDRPPATPRTKVPPPKPLKSQPTVNGTDNDESLVDQSNDTLSITSLASVVTNADMQAAIKLCSAALYLLAGTGPDPNSNKLMMQISTALKSCQNLNYYLPTLQLLSPHIERMKAATAKTKKCREKALPAQTLVNLNANMVWWKYDGYYPTQQRVQNLFNTASQCIERYC
ncbi:hypothetical protein Y032_0081g1446 [Ancylostoma ceylanicum]|uniref:Uncharacterized protein n=1 Tax=Ancylostoma ceylanicum TaxID=53326 RepID=A0A016TT81_9BILA|nr:hypothetical protein Y032_0081g1446 [Ancylostoma ceylanicum]